MKCRIIIISFLFDYTRGSIYNDLIIDYFRYKKAPIVVGYSCNSVEDNVALSRYFSQIGIAVALGKFNVSPSIDKFAETSYWKLGIFLDVNCYDNVNNTLKTLFEATEHRMFDELRYWFLIAKDLSSVLEIVNDRAFGISTDFVIAVPSNTSSDVYNLYDVYNAAKDRGGKLNITLLGDWSEKRELDIKLQQSKLGRRSNLHGLTFRASFYMSVYKTAEMPLEEYLQDYSSAPTEGLLRYGYNLMTHLSELYNFRLICRETPKWEAGDSTGPIVRALRGNEADLTGSSLTMNLNRTYWIKFIHQSWPFRTCFIFRNPQPTDIKINEILRPFADESWCLLFVLLIVNTIILTVVSRLDWNDSDWMRLSNSFVITIGALCQQGTEMSMRCISTRLTFLSLMVFGLLTYNYYSAGVVSARLSEPIIKINDSLNQMRKLPLKISSEYMVYLDFFLRRSDWETKIFLQTKWLTMPESQRYMEPDEGMRLVQLGGFAYHTHPDVAYPFIDRNFQNHEICELTEVHLVRPTLSTFATTFNSTIVEMARVGMAKIAEVGLRNRQLHKWHYRKPECRSDVLNAASINIYEFAPHLLILMFGIVVAVCINLVEIIYARCDLQSVDTFEE